MERLKELKALTDFVIANAKGVKEAFSGVKVYKLNPKRLAFSLSELKDEAARLHYHANRLYELAEALCAAYVPPNETAHGEHPALAELRGNDGAEP